MRRFKLKFLNTKFCDTLMNLGFKDLFILHFLFNVTFGGVT